MSDFLEGDVYRSTHGEVRIDRVTDEWVYFVAWPPSEEVGAPKRMAPSLFAEMLASHGMAVVPRLDLDALEAALKAMRPGPIVVDQRDPWRVVVGNPDPDEARAFGRFIWQQDAAGIVALVSAAPALIARVRELEAGLREACDECEEGWGYAEEYFRDKWHDPKRLAAWRALLPKETP